MVKVYAPASSANMSVGFDVLGAAVTPVDGALLGDVVTVEAAETFSLNNLGRFADKLPSEPRENIVCYSRQPELAAKLMKDVIAEPYRERLLPGFRQARQAVAEIGAVASGISGSGPTLFALCDKPDTAQRVADWLGKNYLQNQEGFVHICQLDTAGARVLEN